MSNEPGNSSGGHTLPSQTTPGGRTHDFETLEQPNTAPPADHGCAGTSAHFPPGTLLLEKYIVEKVLGRGGMGVVLAARHRQLDELFAIKLLHPEMSGKPMILARFIREAQSAARLTSNHVARVHDVGQLADGTPCLVMEHLDGEDLSAVLHARERIPLDEAVELILQAGDALSEAHARGLVHRDLKPANMFITRRHTGETHLKLLDFGIT
ncbi:MAG: serine/threonine protein kinase, partial [Myxococcales bacterium]|nr:serine/threonine protein kinase [Myxococcales bacterium]